MSIAIFLRSFLFSFSKNLKLSVLTFWCIFLISCATSKNSLATTNVNLSTKDTKIPDKKLELHTISLEKLDQQKFLTQLLIAEVAVTNQKFATAFNIYWRLTHQKKSAELAQRSLFIAQYFDEKAMLNAAKVWAKLAKNNAEAQKIAAGLLLDRGFYMKALPYLENLAKLTNTSNYMLLVNLLVSKKPQLLPKILPSLQRSADLISPNADLFTSLAFVHYYLEQKEKSQKYLAKALKIDKNFLSAILLEANILKREQNFKKAETILIEALERNPTKIRIYLNLAKLQIENGKKDLALKTFAQMIKYADKDAQTSLSLAKYLYSAGIYKESSILAHKLVETKKFKDSANLLLAKISVKQEAIDKAFNYLNQVVTTNSGFFEATYLGAILANKHYGIDKTQAWLYAKKDYAAENLPEELIEFLLLGYKTLNDLKADLQIVKKWLDEAINLASEIGLDDSELIYARSFYWYNLKDIASMEADLRTLVEINKQNSRYLNALAYVLVDEDKNLAQSEKTRRYKEGLALAKRAYALDKSLAITDTLGWAFYKNGDFKSAKTHLEKAHQLAPKDDEIGTHLILVLWAIGENKAAKKLVKQMLNLNQTNDYLKKTLEQKPYLKP